MENEGGGGGNPPFYGVFALYSFQIFGPLLNIFSHMNCHIFEKTIYMARARRSRRSNNITCRVHTRKLIYIIIIPDQIATDFLWLMKKKTQKSLYKKWKNTTRVKGVLSRPQPLGKNGVQFYQGCRSGQVLPRSEPTFEAKPDPDHTMKKTDPDPTLKKLDQDPT